ncbi:hypothetical protein FRC09_009905 [Ceratobasidium sp. 395]|nr:hypothetical protein FRC09_009905 [Ceratobasidium sp. 395]
MFRSFGVISEPDLTNHIANRISNIKRWSWYLGATITQALFGGHQVHRHINLIDKFARHITASESSSWDPNSLRLGDKLSCLEDLVHYILMTSTSRAAYHLIKLCVPIFLELATKIPHIWTSTSAISIAHALCGPMHEMRKFVLWDTMAATAFGSVPLLHYDTTIPPSPAHIEHENMILEWVYGCPAEIVVLFAKINGWRASRWMGQPLMGAENNEDWRQVEENAKQWTARIDRIDESAAVVGRLAVQESLRQAVLIYLYMVMCDADSGDSRVVSAVRQIVQLASTIGSGNPLEIHLMMPCLIAGVAARQEQHRSLLRRKLQVSRNENVWCLRGADFVPVLDHVWHGAGAGGYPVIWDDYVNSRCIVLPLDTPV